jgi:hypothetical protein
MLEQQIAEIRKEIVESKATRKIVNERVAEMNRHYT